VRGAQPAPGRLVRRPARAHGPVLRRLGVRGAGDAVRGVRVRARRGDPPAAPRRRGARHPPGAARAAARLRCPHGPPRPGRRGAALPDRGLDGLRDRGVRPLPRGGRGRRHGVRHHARRDGPRALGGDLRRGRRGLPGGAAGGVGGDPRGGGDSLRSHRGLRVRRLPRLRVHGVDVRVEPAPQRGLPQRAGAGPPAHAVRAGESARAVDRAGRAVPRRRDRVRRDRRAAQRQLEQRPSLRAGLRGRDRSRGAAPHRRAARAARAALRGLPAQGEPGVQERLRRRGGASRPAVRLRADPGGAVRGLRGRRGGDRDHRPGLRLPLRLRAERLQGRPAGAGAAGRQPPTASASSAPRTATTGRRGTSRSAASPGTWGWWTTRCSSGWARGR
jgi:hypothetical protein